MTHQEVMEKIKKLMALSKSSNENEAALALERAQKLMEQYSVSMEDVSLSEITEQSEFIAPGMRDRMLFTTLAGIVSKAFGVEFYIRFTVKGSGSSQATQTVFIGPKDRLQVACYTYTILSRQACNVKKEFSSKERARVRDNILIELSKQSIMDVYNILSTLGIGYDTYVRRQTDKKVKQNTKAYVFGWLYKVYEKVMDFSSSIEEQKLSDNYISKNHPDLSEMRGPRTKHYTKDQLRAYKSGKSDAENNVQLYQGVSGGLSRAMITA